MSGREAPSSLAVQDPLGTAFSAIDWTAHPLGPPSGWPVAIRVALATMRDSPQAMCLCFGAEHHLFYNGAYAPMLGAREAGAMGRPLRELWPEVWDGIAPLVERALRGESSHFEDMPMTMTRNGYPEETWWTFTYMPLRDEHGIVLGMLCTTNDTSGRVLAARRQRAESDDLLRRKQHERDQLWALSEDMMARADYGGGMVAVNPAWTRVLGYSEQWLLTHAYADIIHPGDVETVVAALQAMGATGRPTRFRNRILAHDGSWKPIGWTVSPEDDGTHFIAIGRDLTEDTARERELLEAQEALRQSQKMEAVGQLTGGIAHDFNNLLAGMSGALQLLVKRVALGQHDHLGRYVDMAQGSIRRAATLTQRLLAFSRRQTLDPRPLDANRLVDGMAELIRRTVGPSVRVEVVHTDALWTVRADPSQLESSLLNLCINARDAMLPDGGRLTIECSNHAFGEREARERDLPAGDYVSICVVDTGTGMTPEVQARAFDPFFTTKPQGQGTGLGLSMVYGFVRQSGGQVRIETEPGRGTTLCMYFPRHLGEAPPPEAEPPGEAPATGQGQVVVLVEDEAILRSVVAESLREAGFRVLEAADGPSGLRVLQDAPRVDLLITDVGLPGGMNGRQVADAARVARPALRILFITGYAENAAVGDGNLAAGMQVMTKPFDMDALATRVKDMVEA